MVQLTQTSLSKRHQELNNKVNEAVSTNINFNEVKSKPETSDVDRLFKIDIAAKYKNIDYIIETLKSGDSLYVSRALNKCPWLYDNEYSTTINAEYLHHQIFPFMSIKMKKKLLTAVSVHLKNSDRAEEFHKYCLRIKMSNFAEKFIINTSESYKLNVMQETKDSIPIKCIGNSFTLFEKYLEIHESNKNAILSECYYLYSVSDVKYLDLLEKHAKLPSYPNLKLGLRMSKDIVTKHKDRVLAKPKLYVNILNMTKLLRHSSLSDVKLYAVGLLPQKVSQFWIKQYYKKYKPIIHAIPEGERYAFIKKIFADNYTDNEFEMTKQFYDQEYYNLMNKAERELWALNHIASDKEILGPGLNYLWYKFVVFEKAFVEIKKMIMTATDPIKRLELLGVLVQSACTQRNLEQIFKYYYERHVNESNYYKESFLNKVLHVHNVFEFDEHCWEALNKIFSSLDIYAIIDTQCNPKFKIIAILHHIINNKEMPEALTKYIETEISMYSTKKCVDKLSEEKKEIVYTYIIKFYLDRITKFVPGSEDDKCKAHIHFTLEFMATYQKTRDDIPNAIMEFVNNDFKSYRYQQILESKKEKHLTESDLIRDLKKDSALVANKTLEVIDQIKNNWYYKQNRLLKKIKIYFSEDNVLQKYLKLFNESLNEKNVSRRLVAAAVFGIFHLSDEQAKIEFMDKFAPPNPKIDSSDRLGTVLATREAICRFASYSRPPVPLPNILMYLKGDYVKYCLPMFNMYLSNLPQNLCLKFVESLLDAPVSIQKHGLRLAFKCFGTEYLKNLVLTTWKKTKNVSLRGVIYQAFFKKAVTDQDREMHEVLRELTRDLHDDDKPELFELILSKQLTNDYTGDFFDVFWAVVQKFKDNNLNIQLKTNVITYIDQEIHHMKKETVKEIVTDHLNVMFSMTETHDAAMKMIDFHLARWNLVVHYIIHFTDSEEDRHEGIKMVKLILCKIVEGWNGVVCDVYVFRQICVEFIKKMKNMYFIPHPKGFGVIPDRKRYVNSLCLFETILNQLQESLPLYEIYSIMWDLKITIINMQVVKDTRVHFESVNRVEGIVEAATEFGRRLGHLVKDFVKDNTYFSYIAEEVTKLVVSSAWVMKAYLEDGANIETEQMLVGIVRGLLEVETTETNLLAVRILPLESNCDVDSLKSVYNTIRKLPEMEVQCSLHTKFSGDFKRRRYE